MVTWDVSPFLDEMGPGQGEPVHRGQALLVGCCLVPIAHHLQEKGKSCLIKNQTQLCQGFGAAPASNQQSRTISFLLANPLHVSPAPILGCYQPLSKK